MKCTFSRIKPSLQPQGSGAVVQEKCMRIIAFLPLLAVPSILTTNSRCWSIIKTSPAARNSSTAVTQFSAEAGFWLTSRHMMVIVRKRLTENLVQCTAVLLDKQVLTPRYTTNSGVSNALTHVEPARANTI